MVLYKDLDSSFNFFLKKENLPLFIGENKKHTNGFVTPSNVPCSYSSTKPLVMEKQGPFLCTRSQGGSALL